MTELLEKAFEQASSLSEEEQNSIANWLLAEIESERKWADAFSRSADQLSTLARQALEEHAAGETEGLDSDSL